MDTYLLFAFWAIKAEILVIQKTQFWTKPCLHTTTPWYSKKTFSKVFLESSKWYAPLKSLNNWQFDVRWDLSILAYPKPQTSFRSLDHNHPRLPRALSSPLTIDHPKSPFHLWLSSWGTLTKKQDYPSPQGNLIWSIPFPLGDTIWTTLDQKWTLSKEFPLSWCIKLTHFPWLGFLTQNRRVTTNTKKKEWKFWLFHYALGIFK